MTRTAVQAGAFFNLHGVRAAQASFPAEILVRRAGRDVFSAGQIAGLGAKTPYGNLN